MTLPSSASDQGSVSLQAAKLPDTHLLVCTRDRGEGGAKKSCARDGSSESLLGELKKRYQEAVLACTQGSSSSGRAPKVRIESAGCLDQCDLGPVLVVYPHGVWFSGLVRESFEGLIFGFLIPQEISGRSDQAIQDHQTRLEKFRIRSNQTR